MPRSFRAPVANAMRCLSIAACVAAWHSPLFAATDTSARSSVAEGAPAFKALRVNGIQIPVAEFDGVMQQMLAQGLPDTPTLRATVRAQVLTQAVLRQEARKQKLNKDPQVLAARNMAADAAENQAMVQRYLALNLKPVPVSDADVKARYDEIVATLGDKEYKPALIAVATESEARALIAKLGKGEAGFAELARKHSLLPTAAQGGRMDWLSFKLPATAGKTGYLPQPVAAVVAALPAGATAEAPVAFEGRYLIVHLDEVRATQVPEFAAAAPTLRRALEMQALERASATLISRLLGAARIE